jgi:hypothetical protein
MQNETYWLFIRILEECVGYEVVTAAVMENFTFWDMKIRVVSM